MGYFFGPGPGWGGPFVAFLVLLLVAAAVALIVLFVRNERIKRLGGLVTGSATAVPFEALRILDERFAKGEIDAEDYKVRRDLLRGPP
jgi:putative membrane protein